jgi:uncharacterized protein (TIGR03435 family)
MNGSCIVSILAGVTAVMTATLRVTSVSRRRRAATRHALLTAAFALALVLPVAAATAPHITNRVPVPAVVTAAAASLDDIAAPVSVDVGRAPECRVPAAQAAAARPHFDVVSVRPCDPKAERSAGGGRGGNLAQASPGRFRIDCLSVALLIDRAYVTYANGHYSPPSARPNFDLLAGPNWIHSEQFTIEATTDDATPVAVMQGPMLQAVLEDRFKLKMHRETRDVAVYELVVAKGGSKLTPFKPGACVPWDWSVYPPPPLPSGQRRCTAGSQMGPDGNYVQTVEALTLDDWVAGFGLRFDRPIVNKTGISGLQTFRFVYSGRPEDFAAEIKNQLGLDLRPARGPREFLILDHVERPVPDGPVMTPARNGTGPIRGRGRR